MRCPIWLVSCQLMKLGRRQTEQLAPHNSCDEFVDADEAREGVVALVLHVLHCGVVWCGAGGSALKPTPPPHDSIFAASAGHQPACFLVCALHHKGLPAQYQLEERREDMDVDCTRA